MLFFDSINIKINWLKTRCKNQIGPKIDPFDPFLLLNTAKVLGF